ncbi:MULTISPECIES: pirin family protein [unclassified Moraxella]|uniref:pirin family protein n=1 Tax=unclassified Moraxella TaxID=2685852 RepID=UPI003AF5B5C8
MQKNVQQIISAEKVIDDGDMRLFRALPQEAMQSLGAFVFIDHYRHQSQRGIGDRPHPHAGIEVISYLLEGSVTHRDSLGNVDDIHAGETQWIKSGKGILHAEVPHGGRHGLQLWTKLPPHRQGDKPEYQSFDKQEIAEFDKDDAHVRVLSGHFTGEFATYQGVIPTVTGAFLAHVKLPAHGQVTLPVDSALELGLYIMDGEVMTEQQPVGAGTLLVYGEGDEVHIQANDKPVDAVVIGGEPVQGALFFGGSFVMDSREALLQAKRDLISGEMGTLDGVPF